MTTQPLRPPMETSWRTLGLALGVAFTLLLTFSFSADQSHAQTHHAPVSSASASSLSMPDGQTLLGEVVPMGAGTARSWVQVDADGRPTTVGLTMTEAALQNLPADATPGLVWMAEFILRFPPGIPDLPFDHIGLNWNPRGHAPHGIYSVPHFDVHFYTISTEARSRITARGDDLETIRKVPGHGQVPEGFMFAPDSEEPGMGGHWVDPVAHEFHGQSFTHTFIYGTYDGQVIFYEPMITKAFFESKQDAVVPLKVPQTYARAGYYPISYSIRYDAQRKEYTVALDGLTRRPAS